MSHIYASGNLAGDMYCNVTADATGRTLACRLYNATDDDGMKEMLTFNIARDTMHQEQWLAVLEELGPPHLPVPNSFPQSQENQDFNYSFLITTTQGFGSGGIDPKRSTFNARAEGLASSSLWKRPLHRHCCLVPVSGYYEWCKSDRQAFRFTVGDEPVFCLTGLGTHGRHRMAVGSRASPSSPQIPTALRSRSIPGCQPFSSSRIMTNGLTEKKSSGHLSISFVPSTPQRCRSTMPTPRSETCGIRDRSCSGMKNRCSGYSLYKEASCSQMITGREIGRSPQRGRTGF